MPDTALSATDILARYRNLGFRVVFFKPRTKGPTETGWTTKEYQIGDYREGQNVGVMTGVEIEPGRFLADADFDRPEGARMILRFFPRSNFGFGRASKPFSHLFYTTNEPFPSYKFEDLKGKPFLELRSAKKDGSIGL